MLEAQRRTWKPGLCSRSWLKYPNAWKLLKGLEIRCFTKGNSANLVTRKTGGGGKECPPSSTGNVWNTPKQAQASRENSSLLLQKSQGINFSWISPHTAGKAVFGTALSLAAPPTQGQYCGQSSSLKLLCLKNEWLQEWHGRALPHTAAECYLTA